MEKEIIQFLDRWFKAELKARNASIRSDWTKAKASLIEMNQFAIEELHNQFGMIPRKPDDVVEFDKRYAHVHYKQKRYLYKMSEYESKKFGRFFLAFVSPFNPIPEYMVISNALFIGVQENDWKILRVFGFDEEETYSPWFPQAGNREMDFKSVGELKNVFRYLEPNEEASQEEYLKNY